MRHAANMRLRLAFWTTHMLLCGLGRLAVSAKCNALGQNDDGCSTQLDMTYAVHASNTAVTDTSESLPKLLWPVSQNLITQLLFAAFCLNKTHMSLGRYNMHTVLFKAHCHNPNLTCGY